MQARAVADNPPEYGGKDHLIFSSGPEADNRIGIYAHGGCDLRAIFATKPFIQKVLNGTCCIMQEGWVFDSRSDLLLQTLRGLPEEWTAPVIERLQLEPDYFRPRLFEGTLLAPGPDGPLAFPKKVAIFSIGSDVVRMVYRHHEHDLLVDPGAAWLNRGIDRALSDLPLARWFKDNFISLGRLGLEEFASNIAGIVQALRDRTGAHVMVLNMLGPEPRSRIHNYQFVKDPLSMRRREFNIALAELSRSLNFSIVDADRMLQRTGIRDQVNWAHPHPRQFLALGREMFRVMSEIGVFGASGA